jgi:hypothetical protein
MSEFEEPIWIFPFSGMDVGDSFFIPTLKSSEMMYAVDTQSKAAGIRVRAFATLKDGCFGVRVWRIR